MAKAAVPAKGMTKAQLMTHLAGVSGLSKKDIVALFEEFVTLAYKEAKKEKGFTIPGIGKLVVVQRKARIGHNPKTGEKIKIKARKALKFRIAKAAKDSVLPKK